jgi:hypothetical protein
MIMHDLSRRRFLTTSAALGAVAVTGVASAENTVEKKAKVDASRGKADRCIFVWLPGGACHIDTWDPKRKSTGRKDPGSYYDSVPTAIRDVRVCEHLSRIAPLLDRGVLLRTLHHNVTDEHGAATNRLHTGRPTSGTIVYPSIGSVVADQLGEGSPGVPRYVVMGYPNASRGPGFLGAKGGFIYLTDTKAGPAGLSRPAGVFVKRQSRRDALLANMREQYLRRHPTDAHLRNYANLSREASRLAGPEAMKIFRLDKEPAERRTAYGGEFGQRLLLARRLVQAGSRFVEVTSNLNFKNGTGWDTHNEGQLKQHELIRELDQALAALVLDLEEQKLLDRTLVVVATEFGRPASFDGGGGRGHHAKAFSAAMFGGGLKTGQVIGRTDDLGMKIAADPITVPDLHATMYTALGIDPAKELYAGDRPVPITDGGRAIAQVLG